jgi:hypothetical protein
LRTSVVVIILLTLPAPSSPFGTVDAPLTLHQHSEHERLTRAALACKAKEPSNGDCFEPLSLDELSGREEKPTGYFGAVGAPDELKSLTDPDSSEGWEAHCDNADFFNGPGYPQDRVIATLVLQKCVTHLHNRVSEGVSAAALLLGGGNLIIKDKVDLSKGHCTLAGDLRSKCSSLLGLGRSLHGIQDFYSHSNWADRAAPPFSPENPPGLARTDSAKFLDLRSLATIEVPYDLTTGCYAGYGHDGTPGQKGDAAKGFPDCTGRVTHHTVNKDSGIIDPKDGHTSSPDDHSPRGQFLDNFERAVHGAIEDTKRQWLNFRYALRKEHGAQRANMMICALTRDDPVKDCQGRKVAIVIDSSGSNAWTDPSNLRIAAAKSFNDKLVTKAEASTEGFPDLVTVIQFDDSASVIYPLGDPPGADAAIDTVDASGGTDIASGIKLAIDELTKDATSSTSRRAGVIVLTDGEDSNFAGRMLQYARAKLLGIRVATGFLSPPATPASLLPRNVLAKRAASVDELTAILQTGGIYSTIDSAEAQQNFLELVVDNGVTDIDDGGGFTGIFPGLTIAKLISNDGGPVSFVYSAKAGEKLNFTIRAISPISLSSVLHDVEGNIDLSTAVTNSSGTAFIALDATQDVDLELVVTTSSNATGFNSTTEGVFSVGLKTTAPIISKNNTNTTVPSTKPVYPNATVTVMYVLPHTLPQA